ncbi:hypothetical protein NQ317_016413 [Molorchus minor]|uniref:Gustatory receptor n=1 Tax=Molorchus minor TaxID=1323400 RepID=A0ABQ9JYL7_9CUCU|nr:hypothetical protein NQ317_016413 [Molorchus minor]
MNSDYNELEKLFKIGKIMGITPFWMGQIGTVLSLLKRFVALSDLRMDSVQAFLEGCECISELFFLMALFSGPVLRGHCWKSYFYNVNKFEAQLRLLNFRKENNNCQFFLKLCGFHLMVLGLHIYDSVVWIKVEGWTLQDGYILTKIILYYEYFTIFLIVHLTKMLKVRYSFLSKSIEQILEEKTKMVIISGKDDRRILTKLATVQKTYLTLHNAVEQINFVFGWTLFFYFTNYILAILENVNYGLKYVKEDNLDLSKTIALNYIVYIGFYTVSTVAIVMSCDGVQKERRKKSLKFAICIRKCWRSHV